MISYQKLKEKIESYNVFATEAFAEDWKNVHSNWEKLSSYHQWIEKYGEMRFIVAAIDDRNELARQADQIHQISQNCIEQIQNISTELMSTPEILFLVENIDVLTIATATEKLQIWISQSEQLSKWVAWQHRTVQAQKLGLSEAVERVADGRLALEDCYSAVERTYYESLLNM